MDDNTKNSDNIVGMAKDSSENSKLGASLESFRLKAPPKVNKSDSGMQEISSSSLLDSIKTSLELSYNEEQRFQSYLKSYHKVHIKKLTTISDTLLRMEKFGRVSQNSVSYRNRNLVSNRIIPKELSRTTKPSSKMQGLDGAISGLSDTLLPFFSGLSTFAKKIILFTGLVAGLSDTLEKVVPTIGASVGNTGLKIGSKIFGKGLGLTLKQATKSGAKKIPVLGALLGTYFATNRAKQGDWAGAGLELGSGLLSTIPLIGTAGSLGLDAMILKRDFDKAIKTTPQSKVKSSSSKIPSTLNLIQNEEGFRPYAYYDKVPNKPASLINTSGMSAKQIKNKYGTLTIGYGRTSNVKVGDTTTKESELPLLTQRVLSDEQYVRSLKDKYKTNWNENQITALTSFTYNLGRGNLRKLLGISSGGALRNDDLIAQKILQYNKVSTTEGYKVSEGLTRRRLKEQKIFTAPLDKTVEALADSAKIIEDKSEKTKQAVVTISDSFDNSLKGLLNFSTGVFSTVFRNIRNDFGGVILNSKKFVQEEIVEKLPTESFSTSQTQTEINNSNSSVTNNSQVSTFLPFNLDADANSTVPLITDALERLGDYIQS